MCRKLGTPRSLVYYKRITRKIKVELQKENMIASRRKIRRIMDKYGLVLNYTIKQFKVRKSTCNEDNIANEVDRQFNNRKQLEVVISDILYVRVKNKGSLRNVGDVENRE